MSNYIHALIASTFLLGAACGDVEAPPGGEYLPLSSMSTDEAKILTEGGDADDMHTHKYLPLSVMSVEQAKKLIAGQGGNPEDPPPGGGETGAAPWVDCGTIDELNTTTCEMPGFAGLEYEYGLIYNSLTTPHPVVCTSWNQGLRIYNRWPYFITADDPSAGMQWGGTMFYKGTAAADDDTCPVGSWRHHYWALGANNKVEPLGSNGCYGAVSANGVKAQKVYCRRR